MQDLINPYGIDFLIHCLMESVHFSFLASTYFVQFKESYFMGVQGYGKVFLINPFQVDKNIGILEEFCKLVILPIEEDRYSSELNYGILGAFRDVDLTYLAG